MSRLQNFHKGTSSWSPNTGLQKYINFFSLVIQPKSTSNMCNMGNTYYLSLMQWQICWPTYKLYWEIHSVSWWPPFNPWELAKMVFKLDHLLERTIFKYYFKWRNVSKAFYLMPLSTNLRNVHKFVLNDLT